MTPDPDAPPPEPAADADAAPDTTVQAFSRSGVTTRVTSDSKLIE